VKVDWSKWPKAATHVHEDTWRKGPCALPINEAGPYVLVGTAFGVPLYRARPGMRVDT
jgi:hypothetical protein